MKPRPHRVGWFFVGVFCVLLMLLAPMVASSDAMTQGEAIVQQAAKWAGTPYCWDGGNQYGPTAGTRDPENGLQCGVGGYEPPGTVGFDCTGLTLYAVYQATGILLPHGIGQESVPGGTPVARSELQPGDLVFFGPSLAHYTHAGIYAGNGLMWDAQTEGVPVQTHHLYSDYVGATRYWHGEANAPGDGSFVSNDGFVYRMAGGAPIYVSTWSAVGGPQPTIALSDAQFAALPQYPRDGTILDASGGGVFVVAGGSPLYLSNWNAIGGPKPGVGVDEAAIDNAGGGVPWNHLRAYPADGTLLDASNGGVFIAAGGAPLYLSNWNAIGGPKPGVGIDSWDIEHTDNPAAHLNPVPANGTLISSTATGMVYEIAGGAPLYVSNWSAIGGARPAVGVDQWDLDNINNPAAHLNPVPANGTLLGSSGGGVFVVAGGAPLYLSSWSAIGGPKPCVAIDEWDIANATNPAAHLNAVPVNGTFLNTSTGHVYRIAGGAPFAVSSWEVFGGVQAYVTVDEWDIDHVADPAAHLHPAPADGTSVEGLPSHTFWSFQAGLRNSVPAAPGATTVDDFGLSAYPQAPPTHHIFTPPQGKEPETHNSSEEEKKVTKGGNPRSARETKSKDNHRIASLRARCRKRRSPRSRAKCLQALNHHRGRIHRRTR